MGVIEEGSRKVQKAGTHAISFIVEYRAVVEIHAADTDVKPPALPNKEGKCQGNIFQRGDG